MDLLNSIPFDESTGFEEPFKSHMIPISLHKAKSTLMIPLPLQEKIHRDKNYANEVVNSIKMLLHVLGKYHVQVVSASRKTTSLISYCFPSESFENTILEKGNLESRRRKRSIAHERIKGDAMINHLHSKEGEHYCKATPDEMGDYVFVAKNAEAFLNRYETSIHLLPCRIDFTGVAPVEQFFRPIPLQRRVENDISYGVNRPSGEYITNSRTFTQKRKLCFKDDIAEVNVHGNETGTRSDIYETLLYGRWLIGKELKLSPQQTSEISRTVDIEFEEEKEKREYDSNSDGKSTNEVYIFACIGYVYKQNMNTKNEYSNKFNITPDSSSSDPFDFVMSINAAIPIHHLWSWEQDCIPSEQNEVQQFLYYLHANAQLHSW